MTGSSAHSDVNIRLINEAKWILGDPSRRKDWEEVYFSSSTSSCGQSTVTLLIVDIEPAVRVNTTPHVSYDISLSAFTPHYRSNDPMLDVSDGVVHERISQTDKEVPQDAEEPIFYTHPCRCSSDFVITYQDLEDGIEVVGCGGCGEWVRVCYETVDEE